MSTPSRPATAAGRSSAPDDPDGTVTELGRADPLQEIAAEQKVVDRAYTELDRQLAAAREALAATEAKGVSGTHQSRGERDAYAVHYTNLVTALEGVEDRLVFGRMDMTESATWQIGRASCRERV